VQRSSGGPPEKKERRRGPAHGRLRTTPNFYWIARWEEENVGRGEKRKGVARPDGYPNQSASGRRMKDGKRAGRAPSVF